MTVQSIRTPVQVRNIAGNQLFVAPGQMAFGEMNRIGELDHLPQEVRSRAEALHDAGYLGPSRSFAPEVVGFRGCAGCFGIFYDFYFCLRHAMSGNSEWK
jgi:hypothetical protein